MRLTPEHHATIATAIGRREWARTRTDMERATLVLEHMSGFAVDHVTPLQLAMAMGCMPLNAQDIANYADMACALAMALPKVQPVNANGELARLRKIEAAALRVASSRRGGIVKDQGPLDALDAALEESQA